MDPNTPSAAAAASFQLVPIAQLKEHPLNPRKRFDQAKLDELAASIREKGVLNPLLVRPRAPGGHEILAGARRYRAAQQAGLAEVPVIVRETDDVAALELLVIDNDQREDVHPLEEAAGYQQLMERGKYDVAKIAARIGRSVKYVYDRVKLLGLTKDAQKLFLEDRFTAGHAILLARLKPEDQKRAIGDVAHVDPYRNNPEAGGLFTYARNLNFGDKDPGPWDDVKPVSVRELEHWIDQHVRLEAKEADPMIFPELVDTVAAAVDSKEKVVRITRLDMTPEELRDGPKAILGRSWERADGKEGSKTCEHSVIGNVVIGPGRGEVLRVCVAKDKCAVHWKERIEAAKRRERETAKAVKANPGVDREAIRRQKEKEEQEARERTRKTWEKARPAITTAIAAALKKAPVGAGTVLGKLVLSAYEDGVYGRGHDVAAKLVPPGRTAEDLVRHMGMLAFMADLEYAHEASADRDHLAVQAKAFGVDVKKIVDQAAAPPAPEKAANGKAANGKAANGKAAAAKVKDRKPAATKAGKKHQARATA